MQQLQKSILNKIHPGLNPIFIIAPNKHDGDNLAALLSNYLIVNDSNAPKSEDGDKNYFFSQDEQKLLNAYEKIVFQDEINPDVIEPKKVEEFKSSLKFIVDIGFDTGNLWGLQFDYQTFFDFNIGQLFPSATFIFIYGTRNKKSALKALEKKYLEQIRNFRQAYAEHSILLHINDISYIPSIVLESLPLDYNIEIANKSMSSLVPNQVASDLYFYANSNEQDPLKKEFDKHNLITSSGVWFDGGDILAILIANTDNYGTIINKIYSIVNSFTNLPQISIICKSITDRFSLEGLLKKTRLDTSRISYYSHDKNLSILLNSVVRNSNCSYILTDNLTLDFSIYNILSPFKKFDPTPAFIWGTAGKTPQKHLY